MLSYDPRSISSRVYRSLQALRNSTTDRTICDEQKSQAVELYTYIATWGLLRLKGEETALGKESKRAVVICFFQTLSGLAFPEEPNALVGSAGLQKLTQEGMVASSYLGLTGLALQVAQEFAFWAESLYPKQAENTDRSPDATEMEAQP